MIARSLLNILVTTTIITLILLTGCERKLNINEPAQYPQDSQVYIDAFGPRIDYQAFSNTKLNALNIDYTDKYEGLSSLKVTVPSVGDPAGWFSGGAFVDKVGRNLSGYNALTFWAKASQVEDLGLAGFGNDNTGRSKYETSISNFQVTTTWQKYVIPIPLADKLNQERGMFEFAAGADANGSGYYIWFDNIQYENLGTIAHPRPQIPTETVNLLAGDSLIISGASVTFNVYGKDQTVNTAPAYFTFNSSNDTVATVDDLGVIRAVGAGTSVINAKLGSVDAEGTITVISGAAPLSAPPAPSFPSSDVISLLTSVYNNVPVDTWSATWDQADIADKVVDGDNVKFYTNLVYAGIDFSSHTIDASAMNYFHMDIWTPNSTALPAAFKIKLVDFGANGVYGGGDDVEYELTFDANSNPPLVSQNWVSFDIPFSDFINLTTRAHLAQLIISGVGTLNTVWVDNVFFHK